MAISIAKQDELVFVQREKEPIRMSRNNPGLHLLQQVRDEAYRSAQHDHHIPSWKKCVIPRSIRGLGHSSRRSIKGQSLP
jgi:excinuclease ABC subunit C